MQNQGDPAKSKLSGRPNLGKTETIRQRKVDVYLPTTELLQEWKDAAEASGMPLSKFVLEVVEQHRQGVPKITLPAVMLEEKANRLEKELAVLQMRFETLNQAFHNQEVELSRLSSEHLSAKEGSVDIPMVRNMVHALRSGPRERMFYTDLWRSMCIDSNNSVTLEKWNRATLFLIEVGLVDKAADGTFGWKNER